MKTLAIAVKQMTPRSVEEWLESQEGTAVTFKCDDCYECLFAKYLGEQISGVVDVGKKIAHFAGDAVLDGDAIIFRKEEEVQLPGWAMETVALFDSGRENQARGVKGSLRVLRAACLELAGKV